MCCSTCWRPNWRSELPSHITRCYRIAILIRVAHNPYSNAGERIKRAVNHLFHQASLYPLDPPQLDVGVDSELAARYAQLRTVPHVLLVPGELKCFIRDIGGCLVLNPGRLTDRKARGTFARLVIHKATVAAAAAAASSDDVLLSNYMACQVVKM